MELKIEKLRNYLTDAETALDTLSFDNFDTSYPQALNSMKKARQLRTDMLKEFGTPISAALDKIFSLQTKQIKDKFDNIVEVYSNEEKRLNVELKSLSQKKKLTAYLR